MDIDVLQRIFKAYDIRGAVPNELTPTLAHGVGRALADYLPQSGQVAVGYDMRPDSRNLATALVDGLRTQGRDVLDIGLVTSDMIYFVVGKFDLAGGAMVTASHNPGNDNGIKIYRDGAQPVGLATGLERIRQVLETQTYQPPAAEKGKVTVLDITQEWLDHCLSFLKKPLPAFRIAIDAGNGMAGKMLPAIEARLPLQVTRLYYDLDGTFPHHEANPTKVENLADLIRVVRENHLDFGIAFDGDGDRAGFVDDQGRPVSGSDLVSLVAGYVLKSEPGAEIVHEVRTSRATRELITEWGGQPKRVKAGRIYIGTAMRADNAPFGGETSGHLFFRNNYFADSGLIGALVAMAAIAETGQRLSSLIDSYHRYAMEPEVNFRVRDPVHVLERLARHYTDGNQDRLDGLTVEYPSWWFNLRVSNTEPVIRLNIEAKDPSLLREKTDEVVGLIEEEQ